MQRSGSGFKKIINAYETQHNYRKELSPVFKAFNNDFILVLYNLNYGLDVNSDVTVNVTVNDTVNVGENVGVNVGVNGGVNLNKTELDVYNELIKNNSTTAQEISEKLNKTKRTIERIINSLKEKNMIKRAGSDKTGHWEIIN